MTASTKHKKWLDESSEKFQKKRSQKYSMAIGSLCNFLSFRSISLNNSVHRFFFGRKKSMISRSVRSFTGTFQNPWNTCKVWNQIYGQFLKTLTTQKQTNKKKRNGTSNDRSTSVLRIETVIVRFLFWETNPNQGGFASPKGWCFGIFSAVGFDWDFLGESPSVLLL